MKKNLEVVLLLSILLLSILIAVKRVGTGFALSGDTGQIYMILQNIHDGLGPYNQILPSLLDLSMGKGRYLTMPSDQLCKLIPETGPFLDREYNHFLLHTYLIMYPMSILVYFIKVPYVINLFNILAFIGFLYIAFKICNKKINWVYSLIICLLVSFHPAWSWSFMGQPYIDRLFLPIGLIIIYIAETNYISNKKLILTTILSGLIVEKIIIYICIYIFTTSILNYSKFKEKKVFYIRIIFSLLILITIYLLIKNFMITHWYSAVTFNIFTVLDRLKDPRFLNGFISLMLISIPFLIPSLIYRKKLFIIALIMLLPNLTGTIGGSEKVGFFTHYHTLYYPFLTFAFLMGCCSFIESYKGKYNVVIVGAYFSITASFYILVGYDANLRTKLNSINHTNMYLKNIKDMWSLPSENRAIQNIIDKTIEPSKSISSVEPGWPYLYKYKNIVTYPYNINSSDYLIIHYTKKENSYSYFGYTSYLGDKQTMDINSCFNNTIIKYGFKVNEPIILNSSMAILKK